MTEIADYIKTHYYPRYQETAPHLIPDHATLVLALKLHSDKTIVVSRDGLICGVAVYLKLDDKTFEHIESFDISRVDVLSRLLEQNGNNFHFILLTADCSETIRVGLSHAKSLNPRSISWWSPDMTRIHRIQLREK